MSSARPILSGKAQVVVPGVAQQQRVDGLGPDGDLGIAQDEIRQLREAIPRDRIGGIELHVLLDLVEPLADVLHARIVTRA